MKSRTENSLRNTMVALLGQTVTIVMTFLVRTAFIKLLDISYLGINGLFSNVLSLLSFAELGFGTAITYALYKPIASDDKTSIAAIMNFYKRVYRVVGCFVFFAGCALIPNLNFFIGDLSELPSNLPPLWCIYLLYLINTSISYFFNYKRTLVIASQNGHFDTINTLFFNIAKNILQLAVLYIWNAYLLYLLVQIICTFLSNIFISQKADQIFPYLKDYPYAKLDSNAFTSVIRNVIGMSCHKLGEVIVLGTDNILISKFVGIAATGMYSNYYLITSTVRTFYLRCFSAVTASVGNYLVQKDQESINDLFYKLFFLNGYIAIFTSTCLFSLLNPFITLIWGNTYTFNREVVFFIVLNFYLACMRQSLLTFLIADGLFWELKWKSLLESIINLFTSIFFAKTLELGLLGILAGTTASTVFTNLWWEPFALYKHIFHQKLYNFFVPYTKYTLLTILSCSLVFSLSSFLQDTLFGFCIKFIASFFIPNVVVYLFYGKSKEYHFYYCLAKKFLNRIVLKSRINK